MNNISFLDLLDALLGSEQQYSTSISNSHPNNFEYTCPSIKRVTFNGNTTIVWFNDDSRCVVACSPSDKYDRKTAIVYAIVKRLMGKVGKYDKKKKKWLPHEVDGAGFGEQLQKIVDAGFDQELEEKTASEKKQKAHEAHVARQKAQQEAAFKKRVEARAKQILLERAALDRANEIEDFKHNCICKEHANKTCSCKSSKTSTNILDTYIKPDKPFSQFTPEEKHEYWRYHNAKRRAKN